MMLLKIGTFCPFCTSAPTTLVSFQVIDKSNFFNTEVRSLLFGSLGDPRVTEHPQLAVMHTIWAREHNRIATALSALNPKWNDETIFQETRRIVGAEMQQITYYEWLPALIGM